MATLSISYIYTKELIMLITTPNKLQLAHALKQLITCIKIITNQVSIYIHTRVKKIDYKLKTRLNLVTLIIIHSIHTLLNLVKVWGICRKQCWTGLFMSLRMHLQAQLSKRESYCESIFNFFCIVYRIISCIVRYTNT